MAEWRFTRAIQCDPYQPLPRVGLALARLATGNDAGAAQAMRRAMFYDANVLLCVPMDSCDRAFLGRLAMRLERQETMCHTGQNRFLQAALNTMRGHLCQADVQIHQALAMGDRSLAARALKRVIHEKLHPPTDRHVTRDPHRYRRH